MKDQKYRCDLHSNVSDTLPCPWPDCPNGVRVIGHEFRLAVPTPPTYWPNEDDVLVEAPQREELRYRRQIEFFRRGTHQYGIWVWVLEK